MKHVILWGLDKSAMRAEIFCANRNTNGGINKCVKCGNRVIERPEEDAGYAVNAIGEWHHIRNKPGERCDCVENGEVRCKRCHSKEHPKPFPKKSTK